MAFGSGSQFEKHCGVIDFIEKTRAINPWLTRDAAALEKHKRWWRQHQDGHGVSAANIGGGGIPKAPFSETSDQTRYDPKELSQGNNATA